MSDATPPPTPDPRPFVPPAAWLDAWLAQSHDLLAATDARGRIQWCNPAFEQVTGLHAGDDLLSLAPADWRGSAPRLGWSDALAASGPTEAEGLLRHADGSMRRVVVRSTPVDPGRLWTLCDRVADDLARSLDKTAAQLKVATELADIVIWRHDLETQRVHYNDHGFKVLGIPSRDGGLTLAEARRPTHPDDVPKLVASTKHALATGVPTDVEVRHRRDDGAWRNMLVRRVIELDASGEPVAFVGVSLDVTERHEAQVALHAASERAALIAHHAGIGTWETSGDDRTGIWDAQMWRLRGLEPRAVPLSREERLATVHPEDRAVVLDSRLEQFDSPATTGYEFRVRLPDGSHRWLASRSAALHDEQGRLVRRVGVNWDVTEARTADQARQQALLAERESRAKSQFLARMSHELRTPLNAVLGFTQLLQIEARAAPAAGGERGLASRQARLEHIRSAGEHLLMLIDDALDLSSLQAGSMRLEPQPVVVAKAVSRTLPLVSALAAAQQVQLHVGTLEGSVLADPTRLQQALLNLLTNAIKHAQAGGRVDIDAPRVAGDVRLRVRDSGRGMHAEQLAQLFEPFNRLGTESQGITGSGIGLTIGKALIETMGGRIAASSRPGHGTEISLTFGHCEAASPAPLAPAAAFEAGPARPAPRTRAAQLLYIEDNPVNVLLVEELVKTLPGLRFAAEGSGAAGVARAGALRPDLILVDMQLPDFDGHEVLRRLRADPATARIPCVALSANAMPEDIARALAAGFADYWTKPIRFKAFVDALVQRFPPLSPPPSPPILPPVPLTPRTAPDPAA